MKQKLVLTLFVLAFAGACKKNTAPTYEPYTISGFVHDCGGVGVGGMKVNVLARDTNFFGNGHKIAGYATTDANGKFNIRLTKPWGDNWNGFYYLLYAFDSAILPNDTSYLIYNCDRKLSADSLAKYSLGPSGHKDYYFTILKGRPSILKLVLNDVSPYDSSDCFVMYDSSLHSTSGCTIPYGYYSYEFLTPQHNTIVYKPIFANDSNHLGYYVSKNRISTYHRINCMGAPAGDTSVFYLNY